MKTIITLAALLAAPQDPPDAGQAIEKGLDALVLRQKNDGSWTANHGVAATSIAALALLAHDKDPFDSKYSDAILKAHQWLAAQAGEGEFPKNGHTWIHGQGFATLFLAELYGKILTAKKKPALDEAKLKTLVEKCVKAIERTQSHAGGWWYDQNNPNDHEGSTTVTAVQALRAAQNYGIAVEEKVLAKGFEYLKQSQNEDGGFRYQLHGGRDSMLEGTAAALSTLVFMNKIDTQVLLSGTKYLVGRGHEAISGARFPFYGHFYAAMAMRIIHEDYGKHMPDAGKWFEKTSAEILKLRDASGVWKPRGWMGSQDPSEDYSTGFAVLVLQVPKGNLSIFHRDAPELPKK